MTVVGRAFMQDAFFKAELISLPAEFDSTPEFWMEIAFSFPMCLGLEDPIL